MMLIVNKPSKFVRLTLSHTFFLLNTYEYFNKTNIDEEVAKIILHF
jgi:hypothetical protein